jgi:hypothetical protein
MASLASREAQCTHKQVRLRTVVSVGASAADSQAHIIADKVRPAAVRPNYIGSASRADKRPIAAAVRLMQVSIDAPDRAALTLPDHGAIPRAVA